MLVSKHAASFGLTAGDVAPWRNPGEPAFLAHLVSDEAALYLRAAISGHSIAPWLPGSVAVNSLFIHQKPKVEFGKGEIEIGDLLLVRQHFVTGNPFPQGSAFLLQAKASAVPSTGKLKDNEALQFELYRDWPTFSFPSYPLWLPGGALGWNFTGSPQTDRTGMYGVVYPKQLMHLTSSRKKQRFADDCAWGAGTWQHFGMSGGFGTVDASQASLGAFLEGFIEGRLGRTWSIHRQDHWSQFVMQIMKRAAIEKWVYPAQRVGILSRARIQEGEPLATSLSFALRDPVPPATRPWPTTRTAAERWLRSVDGNRVEGPPDEAATRSHGPRMSLLYVGTFGDRPLDDLPLQ